MRWPWSREREVQGPTRPPRAERRRLARLTGRTYVTCRNCGYGAVKGMRFSNLVAVPLATGVMAYQHASPVVCAGFLSANAQAKAISWQNWLRWNWSRLSHR